jgi:hypothetical protein
MSVAHTLITLFNKKFKDIEETEPEPSITKKYKQLLLPIKNYIETPIYDPLVFVPFIYTPCNYICRMTYIQNASFVEKIMELRIQEIRKKLVYIKYNIELYKLILILLQNFKHKNIPNKIEQLTKEKEKIKFLLKNYIINNASFIVNSTINKYLFLKNQYQLFIKTNKLQDTKNYFIY